MKLYKIKKSNIDNKGLYAAKDIKAGTKIIYYKGKIITKKETEKNEAKQVCLSRINPESILLRSSSSGTLFW